MLILSPMRLYLAQLLLAVKCYTIQIDNKDKIKLMSIHKKITQKITWTGHD